MTEPMDIDTEVGDGLEVGITTFGSMATEKRERLIYVQTMTEEIVGLSATQALNMANELSRLAGELSGLSASEPWARN
jgi:hypothetical protein